MSSKIISHKDDFYKSMKKFFDEMEKLFVGSKIEGNSGYVKLMQIKTSYYESVVRPKIEKLIGKIDEDFRRDAYIHLYTFFSRYFSESGSIYFARTRYHDKIYERIYEADKDVVLFWKTKDLYYIKTDRLYVSMNVEIDIDGDKVVFYFDASEFEGKKNNEKISLIYEFERVDEGRIVRLKVVRGKNNRKTKIDNIIKEAKKAGIENITEEHVKKAIRKFEMQSEVDFFIHKNVEKFLKEQFDLYLKTYVMDDETIFDQRRLQQLKRLKEITYKIIDLIAQFEDELVRIWNKPRFVRNAHYVITLDRIWDQGEKGKKIVKEIVGILERQISKFREDVKKLDDIGKKIRERYEAFIEKGIEDNQLIDWYLLGIIEEDFDPNEIIRDGKLAEDESLNEKWKHLPIDTKYFPDLEEKIVGLFDNLDDVLDGWLIHSENYQALNTILPKWREKVQTIYIDPPYNTGNDGFMYKDQYRHATWLTMMENRLVLARELLRDSGVMFVSIDDNEVAELKILMDKVFEVFNYVNSICIKSSESSGVKMTHVEKRLPKKKEYLLLYSKNKNGMSLNPIKIPKSRDDLKKYAKYYSKIIKNPAEDPSNWEIVTISDYISKNKIKLETEDDILNFKIQHADRVIYRTNNAYLASLDLPTKIAKVISPEGREYIYWEGKQMLFLKDYLEEYLCDLWVDISTINLNKEMAGMEAFANGQKPIRLIQRLIKLSDNDSFIILDFFAGSGTTAHAVMKLNKEDGGKRKFILVEMADYFYDVIIPRLKKVAYTFEWKDGKPKDRENPDGIGIFFKYYSLEQYEEIFRKMKYTGLSKMFDDTGEVATGSFDPFKDYIFMLDRKMIPHIDTDKENVHVDLRQVYEDVDVPETISNITGRKIEWIRDGQFKLEGVEPMDIDKAPVRYARRLLWWGDLK